MEDMGIGGTEMSSVPGGEGGDALDHEMAAINNGGEAAAAEQGAMISETELTCELPRIGWTGERIARLAYLVGLGKSANEISFDAVVRATPGAVYKMAQRLNLKFRDVPHTVLIRLDPVECAALDAEAMKRGTTGDGLATRVVRNCIEDKLWGAIIDG